MKKEIIKSFDLASYKNGAKVKTRNGHEVRIICTDKKDPYYPIIALVKLNDNNELLLPYTSEGKINSEAISNNDIVIVEKVEEPEFWTDKEDRAADGYFIDSDSSIAYCPYAYYNRDYYKNFADMKQAISAKAMARISQIMANDVENFGGIVTDEEWDNDDYKYVINRHGYVIGKSCAVSTYYFLAFHTAAQRDLFLEKYRDLVKEYFMID